ncbi:MAG: hypothetical protein WDN09_03915 [bacterium]
MNDTIKEKIKNWAGLKNWGTPHPLDDNRFFDVIIESYNNKTHVSLEEFTNVLKESLDFKLDQEVIEKHYINYELCLELLNYFEGKNYK